MLRLRLSGGYERIAGRAAWALRMPDRLRIEWLSMMGQPLFTLSGDGSTLRIRTYEDDQLHRLKQTPTVLKRFLQVPIGIDELNTLLVGRAPLPSFEAVQFYRKEGRAKGYLLKNRWRTTVATLCVDDSGRLAEMARYDNQGELRYRIYWDQWSTASDYYFAKRIRITTANGESVHLTMDRFWPNAALPPDIFNLSERQ